MSGRPRKTVAIAAKCLHLQEFMRQKITENYSTGEGFLLDAKPRRLSVVLRVKVVLEVIERRESRKQKGA